MSISRKEPASDHAISRRLKLRNLAVLSTVVQLGSMAKAATSLTMSQPAVSQAVAELEAALNVRLLDRGPRGVVATPFGDALLRRGADAFDAMRQGLRDIEFLSDPGSGEVWIGTSESYVAGGHLAQIIQRMSRTQPRVAVHVVEANTVTLQYQELRARKVDLMLGRIDGVIEQDDLRVERLFDDTILVVAGIENHWARRRSVTLEDLAGEPWVLAPANTVVNNLVMAAFRERGLQPPAPSVSTFSMQLRMQLLADGRHITVLPASGLRFNAARWRIKALPVTLGAPLPVVVVTLKDRTLSAAVQLFLEHARAVIPGAEQ